MSLLDEVECYGFTCYVVDCEVDAAERWSRAEAMQDEREHRAWHEQHPGLVFVDGHAPELDEPVQAVAGSLEPGGIQSSYVDPEDPS